MVRANSPFPSASHSLRRARGKRESKVTPSALKNHCRPGVSVTFPRLSFPFAAGWGGANGSCRQALSNKHPINKSHGQ